MKNRNDEWIAGNILSHGDNFNHVRVLLENGEEVAAAIPNSTFRKLGCHFGSLAGWQAMVILRKLPRMARVIELQRPAEQKPISEDEGSMAETSVKASDAGLKT